MSKRRRSLEAKDLEKLNDSLERCFEEHRVLASGSWDSSAADDKKKTDELVTKYTVNLVQSQEADFVAYLDGHYLEDEDDAYAKGIKEGCKDGVNAATALLKEKIKALQEEKAKLVVARTTMEERESAKLEFLKNQTDAIREEFKSKVHENAELRKIDHLLDFQAEVKKVFEKADEDFKAILQSGFVHLNLDPILEDDIVKQLEDEFKKIEAELREYKQKLEDQLTNNRARNEENARRVAEAKYQNMEAALKQEKTPIIERIKRDTETLYQCLQKYEKAITRRLLRGETTNLSLRMEIKAYELLVSEECVRLNITPPRLDGDVGDQKEGSSALREGDEKYGSQNLRSRLDREIEDPLWKLILETEEEVFTKYPAFLPNTTQRIKLTYWVSQDENEDEEKGTFPEIKAKNVTIKSQKSNSSLTFENFKISPRESFYFYWIDQKERRPSPPSGHFYVPGVFNTSEQDPDVIVLQDYQGTDICQTEVFPELLE